MPAALNRFHVDLLPGHPRVALLEDKLSANWRDLVGGDLGGARVTNWNTQLLNELQGKYDLIIYDVGPSLGALNRSVLVGADFFVAPMGCDIFSLIGVDNIAAWLHDWRDVYVAGLGQCQRRHPDLLEGYAIKMDAALMARFVGYTVQQYITKTIRQERRATGAYEDILREIPSRIHEKLGPLVAGGLNETNLSLGDVPHMFSLVPLAQTAHAPISGLTSGDGLSGGQYNQQNDYRAFLSRLASSLLANLKLAASSLGVEWQPGAAK